MQIALKKVIFKKIKKIKKEVQKCCVMEKLPINHW